LAWAYKYIHICQKSKKEIIVLKLDFEKAFDKIEHEAMLSIMQHKGFTHTWISWMRDILILALRQFFLMESRERPFIAGGELGKEILCLLFCLSLLQISSRVSSTKQDSWVYSGYLSLCNTPLICQSCNMPMTP